MPAECLEEDHEMVAMINKTHKSIRLVHNDSCYQFTIILSKCKRQCKQLLNSATDN